MRKRGKGEENQPPENQKALTELGVVNRQLSVYEKQNKSLNRLVIRKDKMLMTKSHALNAQKENNEADNGDNNAVYVVFGMSLDY